MTNENPDNYEQPHNDSSVTDVFESKSSIPKDDGIDYLRDVNVALQDIINLFKTTLEALERSLSRRQNPNFSSVEDFDSEFIAEKTSRVFSTEAKNEVQSIPNGISRAAYGFLNKLRFLVELTEKRITVSPTEQQDLDRKLRHAVRSSGKTEMEIKFLTDSLTVQRSEHKKSVDKLMEELNDLEKSSYRKSEEIRSEIERIVNESEIKMASFYKEFIIREEKLRAEMKILETILNNLRGTNILVENKLRDKRCKVEKQLLESLGKYDKKIGGRHREMENLAKEFELLNTQRKMLEEDVMISLRKVHDDLQKEKAQALQQILNERVEKFVRNRAAIVIQKAWRAYWERHCAKKKKKSRKK